jgi:hypothetical protein
MVVDNPLLMGYCRIVDKRGNHMIRDKEPVIEIIIDLTGPEGNTFVLLGYASRFAKQLGIDPNEVTDKMTSGDYENLIEVFDSYFGDFVVLER